MTKKTSTPRNPPRKTPKPAWNKMTGTTAQNRSPSISLRYFTHAPEDEARGLASVLATAVDRRRAREVGYRPFGIRPGRRERDPRRSVGGVGNCPVRDGSQRRKEPDPYDAGGDPWHGTGDRVRWLSSAP